MKRHLVAVFLIAIAFPAFVSGIAQGQETNKPSASPDPDISQLNFLQLREKRDALDLQIQQAQAQKATLDTILYWLRKEEDDKKELAEQLKAPHPDKSRVEELKKNITIDRNSSASDLPLAGAQGAFEQKQNEIATLLRSKDKVERAMSEVIDIEKPKQSFKTIISSIFAGLVAAVIVGFFVVSWRDEKVRREIFSGQSGIQFLTLFSLVIAIILFGITPFCGSGVTRAAGF
jgi:Rad3-related DNA helicase